MLGLWKLAAMSAVIGAGLVVVWQAQQGLQAVPAADQPSAAVGDGLDSSVALGFAQTSAPANRDVSEASSPNIDSSLVQTSAGVASVPPESQSDPGIANDSSRMDGLRYRRGLNFRDPPRAQDDAAANGNPRAVIAAAAPADPREPDSDPFAVKAITVQPLMNDTTATPLPIKNRRAGTGPLLLSTDEMADDNASRITLTNGDAAAAEEDPFAAAAPDNPTPTETTKSGRKVKETPTRPSFPPTPELGDAVPSAFPDDLPTAKPTRDTSNSKLHSERNLAPDPFDSTGNPGETTPSDRVKNDRRPTPPPQRKAPPAEPLATEAQPTEDPFNPFPDEAPVKPRKPKPLPTDADAQSNMGARAQQAGESDPFDPFPEDAPSKTRQPKPAPTDSSAPTLPGLDRLPTPLREPSPVIDRRPATLNSEPSVGNETPMPSEPPPSKDDLFRGDGVASTGVPRGVQEPRLTIEKTAPPKAVLGQPLVYTIIVKNIGGSPAQHVTVEDRIPRGSRLLGTAPKAELVDKRLVWKLGSLPPSEERRISIKVVPEEEGSIGSVAKVNFVSEVAAEIVITAPQLKLRVSGPTDINMGQPAEVVFTLSNPGEGDATNVVLRSILPEGLSHPAGNDLEYKIERLAAKETKEVRLELTGIKPGRVVHQAVATADGNLKVESKTPMEIVGEELVLTRSAPAKVYIGRPVPFANKIGNEGTRSVARVKIVETVPTGLEFVEATDAGQFDPSTRTITWTVGPLAPGADHRVSATLTPKTVGRYEAVITATGPTGSVATVKPQLAVEGFPSLAVEPLGDQRLVAVGEQVTTKVQLKNQGTAPAQNVRMVIDLPSELRLVSVKAPTRYSVAGQRLTFEAVDTLAPRTGATFELVLEAMAAGDSRLEMQIAADHLRRAIKHDEAVQVVQAAQ